MKKLFLYMVVSVGLLLPACTDEDKIHVSEEGEPFYTLPQGNHVYDKEIVGWFEKYGFYMLYDFSEGDLYWNDTEWEEYVGDRGHLVGQKADTNYVWRQVELFRKLFLEHYPDDFIKQAMPLKVLLCSKLQEVFIQSYWDEELEDMVISPVYTDVWSLKGYDYLGVNGGSCVMENWNDSLTQEFSLGCNSVFLRILGEKKILQDAPEAFFEISKDYYGSGFSQRDMLSYGFLSYGVRNAIIDISKYNDFLGYLELVGYPLDVLNGEPGNSFDPSNPSLRGIFNEELDVNGLIRKKYDIMVEWLKMKGIDMESLQNPQLEE